MKRNNGGFITRFIKMILSVLILSTLIITIALVVKEAKNTNETKVARAIYKVLSIANINVEQHQVEQVAGDFIDRLADSDISSMSTKRDVEPIIINDKNINSLDNSSDKSINNANDQNDYSENKLLNEIAFISDVHQDLASLTRVLNTIKKDDIKTVVILGDLTDYGDIESLSEVKKLLDSYSFNYYVLPGDHDLAQSVGPSNYISVFGNNLYSQNISGEKFLFLDNSANFTPLTPSTLSWFNTNIKDTDYLILSQPLYTDTLNIPFRNMYMGSTFGDISQDLVENQTRVKEQRDLLLEKVRNSNVKTIIAGDHHKSSSNIDPINNNLEHNILGSISNDLNGLPQKLIQSPRFSILSIYDDKSFSLEDVLID